MLMSIPYANYRKKVLSTGTAFYEHSGNILHLNVTGNTSEI
jgi:hypothetical protein